MTRRLAQHWICVLACAAAAVAAQATDLRVVGLDGAILSGRVLRVAPEVSLATDAGEKSLAWNEILEVRVVGDLAGSTQNLPTKADVAPLRFALADGTDVRGSLSGAAGELRIAALGATSTRIDPSIIRAIVAVDPPETARDDVAAWLSKPPTDSDGVIVAGSAKAIALLGTVQEMDTECVQFSFKGQQRSLPWRQVAGVFLSKSAARGAAVVVRLADGQRVAGRVTDGGGDGVVLTSSVFERLALPWSRIERIEARSERLQFLSDLTPLKYEFETLFSARREPAFDQTLSGKPIVLDRRTFAKGVVLHSTSMLAFRIDGGYQQFSATVGIVDETRGRGSAAVSIIGDGRVLWTGRQVRGGEKPREVTVEVRGVQVLVLSVDRGDDLDIADHVAFGMARLIR